MEKLPIIASDKGINRDLPAFLVDDRQWSDGKNVRFGKGHVEKSKGYRPFLIYPVARLASTAYSIGAYVVDSNRVYKCTTAGTTGSGAVTWPTSGTVTDGTLVWTHMGVNKLSGVLMAMDNYFKYSGDSYLMAITTTNAYHYDPENNVFVDITGATSLEGTVDYPVVTENAQDCFVFTKGVDPVKYWTEQGV